VGDTSFGFGIKVLIGCGESFDLFSFFFFLFFDSLDFVDFVGCSAFSDGFSFAFLLDMCLFFGFACAFELSVFLFMV